MPLTYTTRVSPMRLSSVPGRGVDVAVQQPARAVLEHPVAQRVEADVGGIVRVVVDAARRAVAEQDVGGRELADQLRACAGCRTARPGRARAPVGHAALEAGERQPAVEVDPADVQVVDPEPRHVGLVVVVAVHAELGQVHALQRLQPARLEVAQRDDRVDVVLARELRGVGVERAVGQGQDPHRGR